MQAFLAGCPCTVEASFRAGKTRSAIIQSAVPPRRRLQHDVGCSLIRHTATSAISSAGRRGRPTAGTHGVGTVDCDNCRTAWGPAGFPLNRSHGNEKRRQRGRRVRRTRRFLLRIWRKRGGHGRSPWRAKIQLCQTYAVLSCEKGGAVFKTSSRVFVAFSSFAVLSCSVRSSPTVNIPQGFARTVEQFSEKCCLFFCRQQRFWCCFFKEIVACSLLSSSAPRHSFQGAWPGYFHKREFRC